MPLVSTTTVLPLQYPVVDPRTGILAEVWRVFFQGVSTLAVTVNGIPGQNVYPLASQPSLGPADAGYIAWITDYLHAVYWTGAIWQFAPGDVGNLFFRDYAGTPQEGTGAWALCDGSATTYLQVGGATLLAAAFTTPNLSGTASYKKTAAAYSGTLTAASGTTGTGTTGTDTTGTGTTGTGTTGTGTTANDGATFAPTIFSATDSAASINTTAHTHSIPGLSVPGLSVPGLSVPGLSVPALAVGSIDMAHLNVLPYIRR